MNRLKCYIFAALSLLVAQTIQAQEQQTNPYIDDRPWNIGCYVGTNFMSMRIRNAEMPIQMMSTSEDELPQGFSMDGNDTIRAGVPYMVPGLTIGFIVNLRLSRHLDLRFTPGLQFAYMPIRYRVSDPSRTIANKEIGTDGNSTQGNTLDMLLMPMSVPVYLRWSTSRKGNYRPYVLGGGGISFNVYQNKKSPVLTKFFDAFIEFGAGCDFYLPLQKFSPQLTYRIGFLDQLTPVSDRQDGGLLIPENHFYTNTISRMLNHEILLVFNIE